MTAPLTTDDLMAALLARAVAQLPPSTAREDGLHLVAEQFGRVRDTPEQREAFAADVLRGMQVWHDRPDEVAAALAISHQRPRMPHCDRQRRTATSLLFRHPNSAIHGRDDNRGAFGRDDGLMRARRGVQLP